MKGIKFSTTFFSHLLFETVSIVIGILLALGVNNWREERKNEEIIQLSLQNIRIEIMENKANLQKVIPYHRTCKFTIEEKAAGQKGAGNDFLSIWRGLNPPMLYKSAFESARNIGALSLMDYQLSNTISQLYYKQQFFYEMIHMYAQVFISNASIAPHKQKNQYDALLPAFADITAMETELSKGYSEIIELLQRSKGK